MNEQNKKVPTVRFKGFTNDWEQHKLGEISNRVLRKNNNLQSSLPLTISAQDGLVDQTTYFHKQVASKQLKNYLLVYNGEFAYNKSYSVGYPYGAIKRLNKYKKGVLSTLYIVFSPVHINSDFLQHYYDTDKWYREIYRNAAEGARNHGLLNISSKDFFNSNLRIPSDLNEQAKIAKLFNIFNTIITLQQRKLDLLKQLKKGLLQKMFADKDSKRPVLRFEGFNDDWERRKLGDLVVIKSGLSTNTQSRQGFYKITRIETISKGLIDMNKTGSVQIKPDDKYLMHAGDILFSNINSLKHIGKVAIFNGKSTLYHGMNLLRMTAQSNVSSYFIYYQLITDKHSNWAKAHANPAVSQASINQHTLSLEPMYITKLEEQHEISDFIGKLDSILTFQQQKLVRINKIKKSLLQQIFI